MFCTKCKLQSHAQNKWPPMWNHNRFGKEYVVKVQRSLAPLSRFHGSHIPSAHEQQCCRFQSYANSVRSPMKFTREIDIAWTTFLGSTTTDHVITSCDVGLYQRIRAEYNGLYDAEICWSKHGIYINVSSTTRNNFGGDKKWKIATFRLQFQWLCI